RFPFGCDVEIDQRELNLGQAACAAQQRAVDAQLRPMQGTVVVRHPLETAAVCLELFELIRCGIVAVRAPSHQQFAVLTREGDFFFVARPATASDGRVSRNALLGGRRGGEAAIEVALFCRELAQRTHGYGVSQDRSIHLTLQTHTGISLATQKFSQRIWLSCRRSPGPFTSMSR